VSYFDQIKNKCAESIKFRQIRKKRRDSAIRALLQLWIDRQNADWLFHGFNSHNICDKIIVKKPETFTAVTFTKLHTYLKQREIRPWKWRCQDQHYNNTWDYKQIRLSATPSQAKYEGQLSRIIASRGQRQKSGNAKAARWPTKLWGYHFRRK